MLTDYNEALDIIHEMTPKDHADIELDDPERVPEFKQPFKRDQHLTEAALFKAKVLAVLRDELDGDSPSDAVVSELIRRVEGITP